jgi:hypothetical protein
VNKRVFAGNGLALVSCALASCGKSGPGGGKCTPKTGQGLVLQSLNLADSAPSTTVLSSSVTKSPRMLGGILKLKVVSGESEAVNNKIVSHANVYTESLDKIVFSNDAHCSKVLEMRKEGDTYVADAFMSATCFLTKALYWGQSSSLALEVFRPASDGLPDGYESIPVLHEDLDKRDALFAEIQKVPEIDKDARGVFLAFGLSTERIVRLRRLASDTKVIAPNTRPLNALAGSAVDDVCLKVSPTSLAAYDAAPANSKPEHPQDSLQPFPADCQILPEGQWWTFKVKPDAVAGKKAVLDALVEHTRAYKEFQANNSGVPADVAALTADVRRLSQEWYALNRKSRRIRLGVYAVDAQCDYEGFDKALCKNKNAYVDIIKRLVAPEVATQLDAAKAASYSEAANDVVYTEYLKVLDADKLKALELVKAYQALQAAMKARKDRVGLATNHVRNVGATSVVVQFKDLALFPPAGVARGEELARHVFSFDNPWLSMSFDQTKAHPLANNLRHPFNEGYAITFAGVPVGAVQAMVDESGGASVIALPRRTRGGGPGAGGGEASNTPKNPGKETTTTDGNAPGGC